MTGQARPGTVELVPVGSLTSVTEGVFSVGAFTFEASSRCLTGAGARVALRPKTAAVLGVLVGRPGETVGRDELLGTVWPEGYVTEAVLTVCVNELRVAFGDAPRAPRYIATVHRHGYRLVADVRVVASATAPRRLFVGRTEALGTLGRWWAQAVSGVRAVGLVSAPAGVGKSALIDEFVAGLPRATAPLVAVGQCVEQFGPGEPYLPIFQALSDLCRGPGAGQVSQLVRRFAPSWALQLPGFVDEREVEALKERSRGAQTERMLREFAVMAEQLTCQRPLVLVLEDLHYSDRSTVELLSYLARRREPAKLLVLGSYRAEDVIARSHPLHGLVLDLGARGLCGHIALELLSPAEVASYLAARLAPGRPSVELVADAHERTQGNALFLVAVTEDLIARQLLDDYEGSLHARHKLAALGMPDEVRLMVEHQVDRLGDHERELLVVASAVGVEFAAEAVAAALEGRPSTVEVERCCDRLASETSLLANAGVAQWPDGTVSGRYRFSHELYRDALYERIAPARRAQVHRRVGERLASGYGGRSGEVAFDLAMHFEKGYEYALAAAQLCSAAETALRRSAYPEALRCARRGLELVDRVADTGQRAHLELAARRAQVVARVATWDWRGEETGDECRRLRQLARGADDPYALVVALLGLHNYAMARSDLATMRECSQELTVLASREQSSLVVLASHFLRMPSADLAGRCAEVWEQARCMLEIYRPAEHDQPALLMGQPPDMVAHLFASTSLWQLGYPDQARQHAEQAVAAARSDDVPAGLARALWRAGTVHLLCGDAPKVREFAAELEAISARHELKLWRAGGAALDGWALGALGDPEGGLEEVRRARASWAEVVPDAANGFFSCLVAELCLASGDTAGGLHEVRSALSAAARTGQVQVEPELLRLKGELVAVAGLGVRRDAERLVARAAQIAEERQARSFQLRALTSLARLCAGRGPSEPTAKRLWRLYRWFTEGHFTADLVRAKAVLDELGAGKSP